MRGRPAPILAMVAFIVFVDMLGIGLIVPVTPRFISEVAHVGVGRAAEIGGLLLFIYAGMQFLLAPVIGGLSDQIGRRPVLLTTLALLGLNYALMAAAPTLAWLVAGRVISGIMGASWPAANSCIADCMPPERRGGAYGLIGGAGAAGYVLGPAVGGLVGEYGTRLPFVIAAALALSGAAAGLFLLAETLPPERRRRFDPRRANPLGSVLRVARTPFVLGCLLVIFFMQLSAQAQLSIWAFWGQLRFGWGPLSIGLTVTLFGVLLGLTQAVLTGRLIRRFGAPNTARWSLPFGLPSYLMLAFAPTAAVAVAAIVIGCATGVAFPALQGLMTARVGEDAQGELQGAVASTVSLAAIIGPVIMTQIFAQFADDRGLYFPGAPYLVSFVLLGCGVAILRHNMARIGPAGVPMATVAVPS